MLTSHLERSNGADLTVVLNGVDHKSKSVNFFQIALRHGDLFFFSLVRVLGLFLALFIFLCWRLFSFLGITLDSGI